MTRSPNTDALLVTTPTNIAYLLDTHIEGYALCHKNTVTAFTDPRYSARRTATTRIISLPAAKAHAAFLELLQKKRIRTLGYEAGHVTVSRLAAMKKKTPRGVKLVPTFEEIEKRRAIKTPTEIRRMSRAGRITVRAFGSVLPSIRLGMTERHVAEMIRRAFFDYGADGLAFESIVVFGSSTRLPHAVPTGRRLKKGDTIQCDIGAKYAGYCADFSRVLVVGAASALQKKIHASVVRAHTIAAKMLRAGVQASSLDAASRNELQKDGLEHFFTHSLGHSLGRDIHEAPGIYAANTQKLKAGMTITIEPGVYTAKLGMRVEDTRLITPAGSRVLTPFTHKLIELPL